MQKLTDYDHQILALLDTESGFLTGDIAEKVTPIFGANRRQHSGAVRSWLVRLEKEGLVKRLDNQTPVCWMKTIRS